MTSLMNQTNTKQKVLMKLIALNKRILLYASIILSLSSDCNMS